MGWVSSNFLVQKRSKFVEAGTSKLEMLRVESRSWEVEVGRSKLGGQH